MANKGFIQRIAQSWLVRQWDKLLFLILLGWFVLLLPGQSIMTSVAKSNPFSLRMLPFPEPTPPPPYPVNASKIYPGSEITATAVTVYDVNAGVMMYSRNADMSLSPASTTKILTALVALDHYQLDDVVTVATVANNGQVMGLVPGEQITVENLLYGALIHSGNDAAWALAEYFPGGVDAFVAEMNAKAASIHLTNSHFTNPVGYDDPNHKMTAADLTRLAAYALSNKTIVKIVAIPQITISDVTHSRFHALTNVNALLGKIPGVAGIKTGWTEDAGENLVTLVERGGHRVIIVVLRSADRFKDSAMLIDWVFGNHTWQQFSPDASK
jgi:D-alanyl-D-alanine carboxypeptidase